MWFRQKNMIKTSILISRVASGLLALTSEKVMAEITEKEIIQYEEMISAADVEQLPGIEIKIARLMQESPHDIAASYLMSNLLLHMFISEPGNYALLRQSTELAAHAYDLNRKSDLSIAAMASILEVTGENDRGLALIAGSQRQGIKSGWRTHLAKARLMFDGRNSEAVLKELEQIASDRGASREILADLIIPVVNARYDGEDLLESFQYWNSKCASLKLSLATANAMAITGHYQEAMSLYAKIDSAHPGIAESRLSQGLIALRKLKKIDMALDHLAAAVRFAKRPSELAAAKTHLAIALIVKGDSHTKANAAALDAVATAGDPESTLIALLGAFRRHSDTPHMMAFLDGVEISRPGLHLGLAMKGEILNEKFGRHHDATRAYTDAITLEPGRSEYYNGRGLAWMGMGKLTKALNDFESAVEVNPEDASARYNVACALARLGKTDEAILTLSKAFELDERLAINARNDSDLRALRLDPRFNDILSGKNLKTSAAH